MESGPFSRKSWMGQSLRVTAKELSLVGGRGKSNAIAERFSKYQKAAEDASSEKKKGSLESSSSSLRSGNLNVLKKRWEQAGNKEQEKTAPVAPPSHSSIRRRHSALTRPNPIRNEVPQVQNPAPPTDQGGQRAPSRVLQPPAAPEGEGHRGMDRNELTHSRSTLEKVKEQVPTSPRAPFEKPKVPLNELTMKSEGGEASVVKGGRSTIRSTSSEDQEEFRSSRPVIRSSSMKERMAKYQFAVHKQDTSHSAQVPEKTAPKTSAHVHEKDTTSSSYNGETAEQPKVTRKFRPPEREICIACKTTVYPLERLEVNQHVYHKNCFSCSHCKAKLSLWNYASLHENIYCKPHFNQLFKAKGNYDEGFGHRPHKELWEPRADGDESGEELKPKEQSEIVKSPVESTPEAQPALNGDMSPSVKVTDLTALLENSGQKNANSAEKDQSADRPAETRKLKIAWPPPAGEGQPAAPLSPVTEGVSSSRPWRAKWPPDDDLQLSYQSSDRAELKSLRRSTSLKERSRPFTLLANPTQKNATSAPREIRRPLRSLQEWKKSFEEKQSSEETSDGHKKEVQQEKQKKPQTPSEVTANGREVEQQEGRSEETQKRNVAAEKEVKRVVKQISLRGFSPETSPSSSPPPRPKENRTSQDVGFWEEDKEGNDTEDLSAEDIIKKNRYYDDEDDDSLV